MKNLREELTSNAGLRDSMTSTLGAMSEAVQQHISTIRSTSMDDGMHRSTVTPTTPAVRRARDPCQSRYCTLPPGVDDPGRPSSSSLRSRELFDLELFVEFSSQQR